MRGGCRVAISGTPGTGKTTISTMLKDEGFNVLALEKIAEKYDCLGELDTSDNSKPIDIGLLISKLKEDWSIDPGIWNVTSFTELRREAEEVERWNIINPNKKAKRSHIEKSLNKNFVPTIAVSDYVKMSSEQISPYVSGSFYSLGTDGFGRSDTRENLRHFFEVDRYYIVLTAIRALADQGDLEMKVVNDVIKKYNIDPNKPNPIKV